jgi:TatD-related deoxyribonuclease
VARRFSEAGGWFIAFVALPPWHYGLGVENSLETYRKALEAFLSGCREARSVGIRVACLAGFHPADTDRLVSAGYKPEEVLELGLRVLEDVARLCREGLLDGIGEVGRQHYKTTPERLAVSYTVALKALEIARDQDCVVHLHLENAGPVTVGTVAEAARLLGVKPDLLLFHHASIRVASEASRLGHAATLPGKEQLLAAAFEKGLQRMPGIMIESDYIDDPRRGCVSSCPWEIVERQKRLMEKGLVDEEGLYKVNVDHVAAFYRLEPP